MRTVYILTHEMVKWFDWQFCDFGGSQVSVVYILFYDLEIRFI